MLKILFTIIIKPIIFVLDLISRFLYSISNGDFWLVLIGASLLITICCLPFYLYAEYLQRKERAIQAEMKEGIDKIKKTFKGSQKYMMLSTFYKQHHYNPVMGLRCSLGLLLQIPFFIAAYIYFSNLDLLQGASLWFIQDLAKPDNLFFIGSFPINLFPILMTLVNIISGEIYAKDMTMNEKTQLYVISLVFLVLLYNSPAGLVIYWTFNNVFALIKNIILSKIPSKN